MMSRMGVVFFLLLLFALASTQQEGDVEARKIDNWSYRHVLLSRRGQQCTCGSTDQCDGSCACRGNNCRCKRGVHRAASKCHCSCQN
uniref:Conotoxin superfamily S n=1 Tax=Conus ermineus TaxID=55423 RepID=A0A346CJI8_CONER|nr:conotoxin precursor superfamily S [Conus ermineus]